MFDFFFSTQQYLNTVEIGTQIPDSFLLTAVPCAIKSVSLMEGIIPYQDMLMLPIISYSSNGTNTKTNASMSLLPHIFYRSMISFKIWTKKGAFWTECITFSPLLDFAKSVPKVISKTAWNNASILSERFCWLCQIFQCLPISWCKMASHFDVNSHFPGCKWD